MSHPIINDLFVLFLLSLSLAAFHCSFTSGSAALTAVLNLPLTALHSSWVSSGPLPPFANKAIFSSSVISGSFSTAFVSLRSLTFLPLALALALLLGEGPAPPCVFTTVGFALAIATFPISQN